MVSRPIASTEFEDLPWGEPPSDARPLLTLYEELIHVRSKGYRLEAYDLLMRSPDGADDLGTPYQGRWQRVPASKYLKYRAMEWREAATADEVPPEFAQQRSLPAEPAPFLILEQSLEALRTEASLSDNPIYLKAVLESERAGKNRASVREAIDRRLAELAAEDSAGL